MECTAQRSHVEQALGRIPAHRVNADPRLWRAGYAVIPVDLDDPMPMQAAGIEESGTDPIMARDKSRWRGELRRLRSGADLATLA